MVLPLLDADETYALGAAILAAAGDASALSAGAVEAREEIILALSALGGVATLPSKPGSSALRACTAACVRRLDAVWSGTYAWLTGWARLTGLPESRVAVEVLDQLFPTKILQVAGSGGWAECEARLARIAQASLERAFLMLGGAAILAELRSAHQACGATLAGDGLPRGSDKARRIDAALDELRAALCAYIVQVRAMVRKSDPVSSALVEQLLLPVVEWRDRSAKHPGSEPPMARQDF